MTLYIYAVGVRTLLRQTSSPFLQQCRSIHLWHAATAKAALGNHDIKGLKPAAHYKDPAKVEIDLWIASTKKHIGRITLKEALADYIKPGTALLPPRPRLEPTNKPGDPARYSLVNLDTQKRPSVKDKLKRGAKEVHFHTKSRNPDHQQILLQKAFYMLANKVTVEFHIHMGKPKKKNQKDNKIAFAQVQNHLENVSLRPDVIGRAMPETSGTIIAPQDAGSEVCWVVVGTGEKDGKATAHLLERRRRNVMSVLTQNKTIQNMRDQHGVGMPLKKERDEIKQRLKDEGQWRTFTEQREDALREMRVRDPQVAKMVTMKANPFATPEELLSLFEKGLRIIEPRRKLLTELEAERRVVAKQIIHKPRDISNYKKRRDARLSNLKVQRKLKAITLECKRLEHLAFEGKEAVNRYRERLGC
jgi:hypothetical protein